MLQLWEKKIGNCMKQCHNYDKAAIEEKNSAFWQTNLQFLDKKTQLKVIKLKCSSFKINQRKFHI